MGVVYKALDRKRNLVVALKTLRTPSADTLLRFKNEFRSLQDLNHPNLVSLYELFSEGGQWFFTMELVKGVDFVRYIRPDMSPKKPGGRLSPHGDTLDEQKPERSPWS